MENKNSLKHIAFIMDGNGRWAKQRNMPRLEGHRKGVETVRRIVDAAEKLGIKHVTFYAFSSENWKRSTEEVGGLMALLKHYFNNELEKLKERNFRIRIFGDKAQGSKLSDDIINLLLTVEKETKDNEGLNVNFCINYGGRDEIVRACQCFVDDVEAGRKWNGDLDETLFEQYLDSAYQPPVDIMVRTGGQRRVSNFLLWQIAYAELYFEDAYWPDFTEEHLQKIIDDFSGVERRFGGVKEEGASAQPLPPAPETPTF